MLDRTPNTRARSRNRAIRSIFGPSPISPSAITRSMTKSITKPPNRPRFHFTSTKVSDGRLPSTISRRSRAISSTSISGPKTPGNNSASLSTPPSWPIFTRTPTPAMPGPPPVPILHPSTLARPLPPLRWTRPTSSTGSLISGPCSTSRAFPTANDSSFCPRCSAT